MDPGHEVRDIHPPREESQGDPHPGGYPRHPSQDGPKGPGTPSGKTPLHAPCGSRGSGPLLPHSARAESEGSGPGVAIAGLPLQARRLEGNHPARGVQADAPGENRPSGTHPSRVL